MGYFNGNLARKLAHLSGCQSVSEKGSRRPGPGRLDIQESLGRRCRSRAGARWDHLFNTRGSCSTTTASR